MDMEKFGRICTVLILILFVVTVTLIIVNALKEKHAQPLTKAEYLKKLKYQKE